MLQLQRDVCVCLQGRVEHLSLWYCIVPTARPGRSRSRKQCFYLSLSLPCRYRCLRPQCRLSVKVGRELEWASVVGLAVYACPNFPLQQYCVVLLSLTLQPLPPPLPLPLSLSLTHGTSYGNAMSCHVMSCQQHPINFSTPLSRLASMPPPPPTLPLLSSFLSFGVPGNGLEHCCATNERKHARRATWRNRDTCTTSLRCSAPSCSL